MILIWNIRTADHTTTTITTNKHSNTPTYARKNESVLKMKRVQIYIEKVFASLAYGVRSLFLFFFIFTFAYSCARLILMQSFLSVSLLFSCFSCSLIFSHTHMRLNFVFFLSSSFSFSLHTTMATFEVRDKILLKEGRNVCAYIIIRSSRQRTFEVSMCFVSVFLLFKVKIQISNIRQLFYIL